MRPVFRKIVVAAAIAMAVGLSSSTHRLAQTESANQYWTGIKSSSRRSLRRIRSTRRVSGSATFIRRFDVQRHRAATIHAGDRASSGASCRAAVIAAAHTALVALFCRGRRPQCELCGVARALSDDPEDGRGRPVARARSPGNEVAEAVLARRATDGFSGVYHRSQGTAIGQWRPISPATSMSAQALHSRIRLSFPVTRVPACSAARSATNTYFDDFIAVKTLGRMTDPRALTSRPALAPFWKVRQRPLNQAATDAQANHLSMSCCNRLPVLNIARRTPPSPSGRRKRDLARPE